MRKQDVYRLIGAGINDSGEKCVQKALAKLGGEQIWGALCVGIIQQDYRKERNAFREELVSRVMKDDKYADLRESAKKAIAS